MRYVLPIIIFLSVSLSAHSQTQGWFTYDTLNSAIPANYVTSVQVDNQNAIWVGTINGLAKFEDFFNWTIWNEGNSDLPGNWINCIEFDNSGRLWIGTLAGGLSILQGGTFTNYSSQNSPLTSNNITSVNFEGTVAWITTDGGGLYRFDGGSWQNFNSANTGFEIDVCYSVDIDAAGNKWIGTLSDGLLRLSGNIFTGFNTTNSDIPFEFVRSVSVENDTSIWVGMGYTSTDSSVTRFNGNTTFDIFSETNSGGVQFRNVWDIFIDGDGNKWICTNDLDHGVIKYNDTTFTDYNSFNSGLPFNRVYAAAQDTANYWFATMQGLAVFNEDNAIFAVEGNTPLLAANVYPNPTTEDLNITLQSNIHQARIYIYSSDGKLVENMQANGIENSRIHISVDRLNTGFYFAVLQAQGRTAHFKFIKQ